MERRGRLRRHPTASPLAVANSANSGRRYRVEEAISASEAVHSRQTAPRMRLLAEGEPMPSGDEIGAQFEQFLAGLDDKPDGGEQ